ncbi:MAG TPA: hypothetical protein DCE78_07540 [Bacteroidetes bacterium]|nr:hypothetical protein [Bacteroidota bacterium]
MSEKELIKQLKNLPIEAQQEAVDFVEFLSIKYLQKVQNEVTMNKKSILESSFRGIWKDRTDLEESTKWIRKLRKSRWFD